MKRPLYTRKTKAVALFTLFTQCFALFAPQVSIAQTTSDAQAETSGPSGQTTQMVDMFTGDFNYSIPLMNVDGFPITLNYNGNVSMHQEASWVGLGWTLNTGAINREMRGIPDDFNGDNMTTQENFKNDETDMVNVGVGAMTRIPSSGSALFLGIGLEVKGGSIQNSYQGSGINFDLDFNYKMGFDLLGANSPQNGSFGPSIKGSLGLSLNSIRGIGWNRSGINFGLEASNQKNMPLMSMDATAGNSVSGNTRGATYRYRNAGVGISVLGSSNRSHSISRDISFGTKTYIPQISNSGVGSGTVTRVSVGAYGKAFSIEGFAYGVVDAQHSEQDLASNSITRQAYGYLNMENSVNKSNSITDFNRENWSRICISNEVLPVANLTYDIFRMSTPMGSATFRAHRNDVGTTNNGYTSNVSNNKSNAAEAGFGGLFRISYYNTKHGTSAFSWNWDHTASANLKYKNVRNETSESETWYFKNVGETVVHNDAFYDQYGGENPSRLSLAQSGSGSYTVPATLETFNDFNQLQTSTSLPSDNFMDERAPRNTLYTSLTAEQAEKYGFEDSMYTYDMNETGSTFLTTKTRIDRTTSMRKNHHISEIKAIDPSGSVSVFNVPVYSKSEKNVVFNASLNSVASSAEMLVEYSGTDNTINNSNGYDELYHCQNTPSYASSFLLRAVLSPDYSDRTNNGLSEDDLGSYVKLNYTQAYGESTPFKWRNPIGDDENDPIATYIKNVENLDDDDYGNYNYGEKELWYTHSIEGKNYIAFFFLSEREDMMSAVNENGGLDGTKTGYKLDKVVLYSKEDIQENGTSAEPLQTVNFVYNYSLCDNFFGNPNGDGKLTLEKVFITTSWSQKGTRSEYSFAYDNNPNYHIAKVDRWGVYDTDVAGPLNNFDHPYTKQNRSTQNSNCNAWLLTDINLPTGGKIEVTYEADDYAYVENRKAMEMVRIKALSHSDQVSGYPSDTSGFLIKDGSHSNKKIPNNVLYLELPDSLDATSSADGKQNFYDQYLKDIMTKYNKMVYFRCRVDMNRRDHGAKYEYVNGFAEIVNYGVVDINGSTDKTKTAYIIVNAIEVDEGADKNTNDYGVHPIMYKAWQDLKLDMSRIIYPAGNPGLNGLDFSTLFNGINKALNNKKFCRSIDVDASFVRLMDANNAKLGGGARVKKIIYKDNWSLMTNEDDFSYGQEYEYTLEGGESSGVASYEPTIGNDENPFRQPVFYDIDRDRVPDDKMYHFNPFGEQLMSAPFVGYSRVKVKNLSHEDVTRNATGYSYHEFFTAKDYPTRLARTPLNKVPIQTDPGFFDMLFGSPQFDLIGMSQGFVVQKNDMHGKIKSVSSYNESGSEISSTEYSYTIGTPVNLIARNGSPSSELISREIDIVSDAFMSFFETQQSSKGGSISISSTFFPMIGILENNQSFYEGFFMTTFNKVIHDYAVLEKVTTRHLGAETNAKNLYYDRKTGQVIASSVQNQYDKPIYSVSYPAWWYYTGFNPASESYNIHEEGVDISGGDGTLTIADSDLYSEGDIICVKDGSDYYRYTVSDITSGTTVELIDDDGVAAPNATPIDIFVLKPAEKNMPFMTMMEYTTLDISGSVVDSEVLSASAVEFSDCWQAFYNLSPDCGVTSPTCGLNYEENNNLYKAGAKGNWRVKKGLVYQENRLEEATASSVDLRTAGTFKTFTPYYSYDSGSGEWEKNTVGEWITTGIIAKYDENGNPIEARDILGNSSSVLFGYNNTLRVAPVAAATNAKLTQIAYDGFEDYLYRDDIFTGATCRLSGHFDFLADGGASDVVTTEAHSGKYSLKLTDGDSIKVKRTIRSYPENFCGTHPGTYSYYLPIFSPEVDADHPYVISVWVKQDLSANDPVDAYSSPEIIVRQKDGSTIIQSDHFICDETPIIDGWQKISGTFLRTDTDVDCIEVVLKHNGEDSEDVFFDDIRIHPFNASMGTISYDPLTLRKLSQGDDYNFTTFFHYDENGFMTRVLQETIKGIVTLTETRSGLNK